MKQFLFGTSEKRQGEGGARNMRHTRICIQQAQAAKCLVSKKRGGQTLGMQEEGGGYERERSMEEFKFWLPTELPEEKRRPNYLAVDRNTGKGE